MKYTLITSTGKIMQFFLPEIAELYQFLEGGTVVTEAVLAEAEINAEI